MEKNSDIDQQADTQWREMIQRINGRWPEGTKDICIAKNSNLWEKLCKYDSRADSLIRIVNKPTELKKKWKGVMDEYERLANCCIAYAQRHLQQT